MAIQPIVIGSEFLMLLSESLNEHLRSTIVGIAIPGISRNDVIDAIVCLPPLAEQQRIVATVNELMTLCDRLKASLRTTQATQVDLADGLVEAAIR